MKIKRSASDKVIDVVLVVFYLLFTIICIYPFYYIIINSISANDLSQAGKIIFLPHGIHFENYKEALQLSGLLQALFISVARTVLGTALCVLTSAFLGFMFTQEEMRWRKFWYRFTIATMYISAGLIPWYLVMRDLHMLNNFWAYIIPGMVAPFYIVLVKTYVESTPKELQEAAQIDGAGILQTFGKIMLPICKPILATVAIFQAVGQWNSFRDTLLLVTDTNLYTLQFILYKYLQQANSLAMMVKEGVSSDVVGDAATTQTSTSIRMTVSVIVIIPVLLIYPFFQRYFEKGIMIGSVKG